MAKKVVGKSKRYRRKTEKVLEGVSREKEEKLLKMSEISLWVDSYDDIFSDFDPRHYSQRALSDDFLTEAKKASRDKVSGAIELTFLVPSSVRNVNNEHVIKRRLRDHFKGHYNLLEKEVKGIKKKGFILILAGILMMIGATYFYSLHYNKFFVDLLIVLFEPGGWFMFWTGLDQFFYGVKQKKPELEFYEKMAKCKILFMGY